MAESNNPQLLIEARIKPIPTSDLNKLAADLKRISPKLEKSLTAINSQFSEAILKGVPMRITEMEQLHARGLDNLKILTSKLQDPKTKNKAGFEASIKEQIKELNVIKHVVGNLRQTQSLLDVFGAKNLAHLNRVPQEAFKLAGVKGVDQLVKHATSGSFKVLDQKLSRVFMTQDLLQRFGRGTSPAGAKQHIAGIMDIYEKTGAAPRRIGRFLEEQGLLIQRGRDGFKVYNQFTKKFEAYDRVVDRARNDLRKFNMSALSMLFFTQAINQTLGQFTGFATKAYGVTDTWNTVLGTFVLKGGKDFYEILTKTAVKLTDFPESIQEALGQAIIDLEAFSITISVLAQLNLAFPGFTAALLAALQGLGFKGESLGALAWQLTGFVLGATVTNFLISGIEELTGDKIKFSAIEKMGIDLGGGLTMSLLFSGQTKQAITLGGLTVALTAAQVLLNSIATDEEQKSAARKFLEDTAVSLGGEFAAIGFAKGNTKLGVAGSLVFTLGVILKLLPADFLGLDIEKGGTRAIGALEVIFGGAVERRMEKYGLSFGERLKTSHDAEMAYLEIKEINRQLRTELTGPLHKEAREAAAFRVEEIKRKYPFLADVEDFISRPGQAPISISPNDTLIGFRGDSPLAGGDTFNITINNPIVREDADLERIADAVENRIIMRRGALA